MDKKKEFWTLDKMDKKKFGTLDKMDKIEQSLKKLIILGQKKGQIYEQRRRKWTELDNENERLVIALSCEIEELGRSCSQLSQIH